MRIQTKLFALKEKVQMAFQGLKSVAHAYKKLFFLTALRHLFKYSLFPNIRPRELTVGFKDNLLFSFKEFTGEVGVYNEIFHSGIYDSCPVFNVKENNKFAVFDIGANVGLYTIKIAKNFPECSVYSFEPNAEVFNRLNKNILLNQLRNVKVFNMGFADRKGRFYMDINQSTVCGKVSFEKGASQVEIDTIDSFVAEKNILNIDILKIDVEGLEYSVLQGADKSLDLVKEIVLEYHDCLRAPVSKLLKERGFILIKEIPLYKVLHFAREKGPAKELNCTP